MSAEGLRLCQHAVYIAMPPVRRGAEKHRAAPPRRVARVVSCGASQSPALSTNREREFTLYNMVVNHARRRGGCGIPPRPLCGSLARRLRGLYRESAPPLPCAPAGRGRLLVFLLEIHRLFLFGRGGLGGPAGGGVLPSVAGRAGGIGNGCRCVGPDVLNKRLGHAAQLRNRPAG